MSEIHLELFLQKFHKDKKYFKTYLLQEIFTVVRGQFTLKFVKNRDFFFHIKRKPV